MTSISVLSQDLINKIAAGEVVERPASVVKELLENSLDAGATAVEVEIRNGGLTLIRVADDGGGMPAEDLPLAVERHATSKIATYDDLTAIASYGFRGEALASIAAVSRLTIVSRPSGGTAALIEINSGQLVGRREAAAANGTSVSVVDLFAAVPARRKFLKAEQTETRRVTEEVVAQALANPGVAFRFLVDGKPSLVLAAAPLEQRIRDCLGPEIGGTMVTFDRLLKPFRSYGCISLPGHLWPRRREQHIFVNRRRISDRLVSAAVYQGYGPALEGRHPAFVVFLEVPPREIDVNVHPAKREVRFRDEAVIFQLVRSAVAQAAFTRDAPGGAPGRTAGGQTRPLTAYPNRRPFAVRSSVGERQAAFDLLTGADAPASTASDAAQPAGAPRRQRWQVHSKYIFAAVQDGIIVVDQHAAHERILFEELLKSAGHPRSQQLLFPATVELSPVEMQAFEQHRDSFTALGFEVSGFGGRTVVIAGLPAATGERLDGEDLLRKVLADLREMETTGMEPAQRLAASLACHAAVKAGQALTDEEMNRLVDRLFDTATPYLDPHGRPAVIKLSLGDIDRRFGRA